MTPDQRADLLASLRAGVPWTHRDLARRQAAARALAATDETWAADLASAEAEGEAERRRADGITRVHVAEPATGVVQVVPPVNAKTPTWDEQLDRAGAYAEPHYDIEMGEDYTNPFARVRVEARDAHGPGRLGLLKWLDARGQMMRPALHPIDPMWLGATGRYYASRKLIMLARKGLRAGGSSTACPILTRCALLGERTLDAGTIGMIPIMSATRDEADGRFVTVRSYLRAAGLSPPKKGKRGGDDDFGGSDPDEDGMTYAVPPGGLGGTFQTKRSASGGGIIAIRDSYGHRIQFRILPALVKHGIGYTGVAGFADESDQWPNDPEMHVNPAEKIFDRITERFTTTYDGSREDPGAELLIFSASYHPTSAHKRAIDDVILAERGERPKDRDPVLDAALTHLVRMGPEAAWRDTEARRSLAVAIGSVDPRLIDPADPESPDLPTWVFNERETIAKCYSFGKQSVSRMLALYGGRAAENAREGVAAPFATTEFRSPERIAPAWDTVIALAPPENGGAWGIVVATWGAEGATVVMDLPNVAEAIASAVVARASVFVATKQHADRVRAEVAAVRAPWAPPVAEVDVYDGRALRTGPLVTRYLAGRVRHAPGLDALEKRLRAFDPETRDPLAEALVCAVERLTSCYDFAGARWDDGPILAPARAMMGVR